MIKQKLAKTKKVEEPALFIKHNGKKALLRKEAIAIGRILFT
jgi:hypothetical protein